MRKNSALCVLSLLPCLLPLSCGSSGSGSATAKAPSKALSRLAGGATPAEQFELAARLLRLRSKPLGAPGRLAPPFQDAKLQQEFESFGDASLRFLCLESGAGADSVWSSFVGGLAGANDAPPDSNNNGSNRDEALAALRARYVFRANANLPRGMGSSFLLPASIPAELVTRPKSRSDYANLRVKKDPRKTRILRPGDLGALIEASARRAAMLLSEGRGDFYGRTPERGMLGLLLLEQALAAEQFLLRDLAWNGQALGSFPVAAQYDPKLAPQILPHEISFRMEGQASSLPDRPTGFVVRDRGAMLSDQARLLRGAAELAWLAGKAQVNPLLRRIFEGDPFGKKPGIGGTTPSASTITWDKHIKGLLQADCIGCHPGGQFTSGGFSVASYSDVLKGGTHQKTNPAVVKKDAKGSLLHQVLLADVKGVAARMPKFGPYWPSVKTDLVKDWIDGGALEKDSAGSANFAIGKDLASLLLKNLKEQFLDAASGALVDRIDLPGSQKVGRSVLVSADSAGEILKALAGVVEADASLVTARELLRSHALFVAQNLIDASGVVHESARLRAGASPLVESAPAESSAAAAVVGGLLAANEILSLQAIGDGALRGAVYLQRDLIAGNGLPRTFPASEIQRLTPRSVARWMDYLTRYYALRKDASIAQLAERMLGELKKAGFVLAEWPETGELLGDGVADTDKDGVPEVGHELKAPLFALGLQNEYALKGIGLPARGLHWSRDVLPELMAHCAECHSGAAKRGGFQFDSYETLFLGGDFRNKTRIVVPGNPAASFLYQKLELRVPAYGEQMPLGRPPLAPSVRALVRSWILSGAIRD